MSGQPSALSLAARGLDKDCGHKLIGRASFMASFTSRKLVLVWIVSWKGGFARTMLQRFALVALIDSGYGMTFAYRCSRPDILGSYLGSPYRIKLLHPNAWGDEANTFRPRRPFNEDRFAGGKVRLASLAGWILF